MFRTGDGGRHTVGVENFRYGSGAEIMAAGQNVAATYGFRVLRVDRLLRIDRRTEILVGDHNTVRRIGAGGDGRAVDLGGTEVGGMMMREENSPLGKLPKIRRAFRRDKVGAHTVEDYDYHSARERRRRVGEREWSEAESREQRGEQGKAAKSGFHEKRHRVPYRRGGVESDLRRGEHSPAAINSWGKKSSKRRRACSKNLKTCPRISTWRGSLELR